MADLITYARARESLGDPPEEEEDRIRSLISAASTAIERWCHRTFTATDHREILDGSSDPIFLRNFPVIDLFRVAQNPETAFRIRNTSTSLHQASIRTTRTGLALYRAGFYATVTELLEWEVHRTVDLVAAAASELLFGWQTEVEGDFGQWASSEIPAGHGPTSCLGQWVDIPIYRQEVSDVVLEDSDVGRVRAECHSGTRNVQIDYRAGFETIPEDIQEACGLLVGAFRHMTGVDSTVRRESLGDYSYERMATALGESAPSVARVRSLLAPYRVSLDP